ncbi:MAG: helix-hairpin-helix domain-containing protein [Chitinophagaceae bacterium]|nr:helix-hairpin-helix domain-containing protein [Chitinophagaceae bacterium]
MSRPCIMLVFLFLVNASFSQQEEPAPEPLYERDWQAFSETGEQVAEEADDDYLEQALAAYHREPLNINEATEADLIAFQLLSVLQIKNFLLYRKLLGKLISVYELQAVPGFGIELIKSILPFITTEETTGLIESLGRRLKGGRQILLSRFSVVPERAKGFNRDASATNGFLGSRSRWLMRYKYQYKNGLQFGWLGDKDPGEPFLKGKRSYGFDFYSFHLFIRKWKNIQAAAIGDFTVNLGQGLIHWQSQAFNKGPGAVSIKRQSESLRPYHSAGEYNFHRGIAVVAGKGPWESLVFASYRRLSANISSGSGNNEGLAVTSVQTSGLHRNTNELVDKGNLGLVIYGGNIKFKREGWHTALNLVRYHYSLPIQKREAPYNLYAMRGKDWLNGSVDYGLTLRNFHVFGELAVDKNGDMAMINGLMASVDKTVDIAVFHRLIGKSYQSLYGNAFTESSAPSNEKGLYIGVSITPFHGLRADLYADFFSFPWLKYLVNAPGYGKQFHAQLHWRPNKKIEAYTQFRSRSKSKNYLFPGYNPGYLSVFIDEWPSRNWRSQILFRINRNISIKNRVELCWIEKPAGQSAETGSLMFTDISFKPANKYFSGNIRLQYFETGGYDSRLYAFENDLLFSQSIPSFFDSGIRYYLNLKYNFGITLFRSWQAMSGVKISQTLYRNKSTIGSGLDEISGSKKTELKLQLILSGN